MLQELNDDIWTPFSEAYAEGNPEKYLDLHTPDMTRVEAGRKWIGGLAEYGAETRAAFARMAGAGGTMAIEFRFSERIVAGDLASERGIFRYTGVAGDRTRVAYGRFHTLARRTPDGWRLFMDYDSDEEGQVGEDEYAEGYLPAEVDAFQR